MNEKRLIYKIRKGNQEALEFLISELYPSIYAFVYRKMQGDDIAKDITQEVFVRMIREVMTYREEGKLLHYLYRIASNLCVDEYRRRKVRCHENLDEVEHMICDEGNLHEEVLQLMDKEELLEQIGTLPYVQQDVLLLHYFHQLTYQEIATAYGLALSTVKSRHRAALNALYTKMKGDWIYEER